MAAGRVWASDLGDREAMQILLRPSLPADEVARALDQLVVDRLLTDPS